MFHTCVLNMYTHVHAHTTRSHTHLCLYSSTRLCKMLKTFRNMENNSVTEKQGPCLLFLIYVKHLLSLSIGKVYYSHSVLYV